ncbi:MAG: hypothetical protein ACK4E2_00760 [Pseudothermotoga sp.]
MTRRISLIGFLTFLVIMILFAKLSGKTVLSVYFECDRELERIVVLSLKDAGLKYSVVESPNKASLLIFDDRIIHEGQTLFLDWKDQVVDEAVEQVSMYLDLNPKSVRMIERASFYRKILLNTGENSVLFELKLRNFALFDNYRIDMIKTILVEKVKVFDKGYLVLPIRVEVSDVNSDKLSFVFDPMSKDLFIDTTLGGN